MKKIYRKKFILGLIFFIFLAFLAKNIFLDIFSFIQVERVKNILRGDDKIIQFENLREFNNKYDINIGSIKNCFYLNSFNGREKYIIGFKLESSIFKFLLKQEYYFYPNYDIPVFQMCDGDWCGDKNLKEIIKIISNPCKD